MNSVWKRLAAIALALVSGCTPSAPHTDVGATFLPVPGDLIAQNGTRADMDAVVRAASDAQFLLVGEGHRNPCDHRMQARVVRAMADAGLNPAIGLEMVPVDKQPVLDRFNAGEIELADIAEELDWADVWGYPFALFRPLFDLARERELPVYALNSPRRVIDGVSKGGLEGVAEEDGKYLPRVVVEPPEEQREFLREAFTLHGEQLPDFSGEFERFLLVQSVWDSMMAEQAAAVARQTGRPVVVVAGGGHVEYGWGIPHRLDVLVAGTRAVTLVPVRDHLHFDAEAADFQFFCPDEYASRLGMVLQILEDAVTVVEIDPGGRAAASGFRPGDVLVEAQGFAMHGFMDLHRAGKRAHDRDEPLTVLVQRRGQKLKIDLGKLGKNQ